jgi:dihydrofolate reductase
MRVSLVVAMARNRVIGRDGTLPWRLPADLARFKAVTMGKSIVMGRRTHASIGRALPGRRNLVLSTAPDFHAAGCEIYPGLAAALATVAIDEEVMIVGGAALYAEALPLASRIYLTEIEADIAGDVHFPHYDRGEWHEVEVEAHPADARNPYACTFRLLERLTPGRSCTLPGTQ